MEEQEEPISLLDTNLIQDIFIKAFYPGIHDLHSPEKKNYKNLFFKIQNFKLVCKLFNIVSKQTLFKSNIYDTEFQIPYDTYLKLSFIEKEVEKCYKEKNINSVLIYSCKYGFYDIIDILIQNGNANINTEFGSYKITPLNIAIQNDKFKTIKELLKYKNLNINFKNELGFTGVMEICKAPFILSSKELYQDIVSLFLSREDLDLNIQDIYLGRTAIMYLADTNQENIIELFLKRNDLDLNIQDNEGFTILMYAVKNYQKNLVKSILRKDNLNLNLNNNKKKTASDIAKKKNFQKLVKILENYKNNL